jgi:CheY-like chemotaxis protein
MPTSPTVRILLIEDHPADIALTRKAFERLATPVQLEVVLDGFEAMQFLRQEGRYTAALRPNLILLDLNMPRMDGREVLRAISTEPTLKTIPVIVLTTSSAAIDVETAYQLCANSYLAKPVSFEDFLAIIAAIETYWLKTALIPR